MTKEAAKVLLYSLGFEKSQLVDASAYLLAAQDVAEDYFEQFDEESLTEDFELFVKYRLTPAQTKWLNEHEVTN